MLARLLNSFGFLFLTFHSQDLKCASQIKEWSPNIKYLNDIGHGKKNLLKELQEHVSGGADSEGLVVARIADTWLRGHKAVHRAKTLKVDNVHTSAVVEKYWLAVWDRHADAM